MSQPEHETGQQRCDSQIGGLAHYALALLKGGLVALTVGTMLGAPVFAAVDWSKDENRCHFDITGPIEARDVDVFTNADCAGAFPIWVSLISLGGDLNAAMEIGRWVRAHRATTRVPNGESCYSSCALIFVGGTSRYNLGELGLHRPYLAGAPRSAPEVRAAVAQMNREVQAYVAEMGVTSDFTHMMINTPPEAMRVFRGDEILSLVPEQDPLDDELGVARMAARYGAATTQEMRQREAAADQCNRISDHEARFNCMLANLWGLSEPVFMLRRKLAVNRCADAWTQEEVNECERSIMLGEQARPNDLIGEGLEAEDWRRYCVNRTWVMDTLFSGRERGLTQSTARLLTLKHEAKRHSAMIDERPTPSERATAERVATLMMIAAGDMVELLYARSYRSVEDARQVWRSHCIGMIETDM